MLNKSLLVYRRQGANIKPTFVDPKDSDLIGVAEQLLTIYNPEEEVSRAEIEEMAMPVINGHRKIKVAKGLNKVLLDRCEFSHDELGDLKAYRNTIFRRSSELLCDGMDRSMEDYRKSVAAVVNEDPALVYQKLYADLPEFERLVKVPQMNAPELLNRYNCSLVQSLLLHASSLTLVLTEPDTAKLRRLFKYLKFFRLLARVYLEDKRKGAWNELNKDEANKCRFRIEVDGPYSLFENTTKYGLQLASFFPAVIQLTKWRIRAAVKLDNKVFNLNIDEKSGLVSHYRHFSAYVPEDVKVFHQEFSRQVDDWSIIGNTPFMQGDAQEIIFPDICFKHRDKRRKPVYLELFHRWHSYQVVKRIEDLKSYDRLILGIDRAVYEKPSVKEVVDNSGLLDKRIFLFRDFPTIPRTKKLLDKFMSS